VRFVTEFNAGRQGPWPSASRHQAQVDHERELRDEGRLIDLANVFGRVLFDMARTSAIVNPTAE